MHGTPPGTPLAGRKRHAAVEVTPPATDTSREPNAPDRAVVRARKMARYSNYSTVVRSLLSDAAPITRQAPGAPRKERGQGSVFASTCARRLFDASADSVSSVLTSK